MPSRRLLLAVAASLLLHAALLFAAALPALLRPRPLPPLQATLRVPTPPSTPADPVEALVKNTLDAAPEKPREPTPLPAPPSAPQKPAATGRSPESKAVRAAEQKLAEHTFYPPEARARGIEGDVRVIVLFADDGSVVDVQLAASSGHALLDNAAIRAVWAMGRLPGVTVREMILPVSFRLR